MLALEIGLGKTLTTLAIADRVRAARILITCPLSVVRVWPREIARHVAEPWDVLALDGAGVKAKAAEAVLEKVEEAKKFASEASGGVADELVPTWMRPYLIGLAFFGGVGAALTRLEGVEKMSGLFRALKR
jgi:SNF2 family DNA or RNA helicase